MGGLPARWGGRANALALALRPEVIGPYHRSVGIRRSVILISSVIAGCTTAAVAQGQGPSSGIIGSAIATRTTVTVSPPQARPESPESVSVPTSQLTHPQVRPAEGGRRSSFSLAFTLREAPGHEGGFVVDYGVDVTAPPGAGAGCTPSLPPKIESGAVGERDQIALQPPPHGWCSGTYRATVLLQRSPYCPPLTPCPEFAIRPLDTGTADFTVTGTSQARNARIVGQVKVCNAPGHCMTRAFGVSATDSSRQVVAHTSTFGPDNRYLLRVPAGTYSLRATSNGLRCTGSATAHAKQTVTSNITCLVP